ncbi:hypothetical protein QYZ87_03270 [Porphyromonadaceae bacterium W3.11]|nr:hypothetical protein [Porphyromonadaceae bacterium W3.11]
MQTITSRPFELKKDINTIFGLVQNPSSLSPIIEKFHDRIPAKIAILKENQISVDTGAMGEIVMERSQVLAPNLVEYHSVKSPVPVKLSINLTEHGADTTLGQISIQASVPAFLSGMIKSKAEPIMAELANNLEKIDFDRLLGTSK